MGHRMGAGMIAAMLTLAAGAAGAAPAQAVIAPKTVRDDVFKMPAVPYPGGIQAHPDIEYSNLIGSRPMLLDLYTHDDHAPPRPLVVWVHGGGWSRGDSRTSGAYADFPAVLASLAARGYVVASVNYRMSNEGKFPAPLQDVKASIGFLRTHAAEYGIDPAKIMLWGGSAGGHLAALAAASCGVAEFEPLPSTGRLSRSAAAKAAPPGPDCVQGAVIWYGLFDLPALSTAAGGPENIAGDLADLLGCKVADCLPLAAKASAVTYVGPKTPPMLLLHGGADKTAPPKQTEEMADRLRKAGASVQVQFIDGADHGWIGPTPAATRDFSLAALQRTFDYIDESFAKMGAGK